jgi:hypothetical protein
MRGIILAALCVGSLVACSYRDDNRNPTATSGSSTAPAETRTAPNDNQDLMHSDDLDRNDQGIKNSPSSR